MVPVYGSGCMTEHIVKHVADCQAVSLQARAARASHGRPGSSMAYAAASWGIVLSMTAQKPTAAGVDAERFDAEIRPSRQ